METCLCVKAFVCSYHFTNGNMCGSHNRPFNMPHYFRSAYAPPECLYATVTYINTHGVYIYETYGSRSLPLSTTHDGTFVEACVCVLPLHTMGALPPLPISTSTRTFTEHTHLPKYIYILQRQTDRHKHTWKPI